MWQKSWELMGLLLQWKTIQLIASLMESGNFHYMGLLSRHNHSKHWVDAVNHCCHDPIGLEVVWATKWWPMQQFTFICSVAEVNANNSQALWCDDAADPQLTFRRNLVWDMIENEIEIIPQQKGSSMKTQNRRKPIVHKLKKRPIYTGRRDPVKGKFKKLLLIISI